MQEIRELLISCIEKLFELADYPVEVSEAPELNDIDSEQRADVATNVAMRLAGELHRNPREIAEAVKDEFLRLADEGKLRGVKVWVAGPGFINFMLSNEYFVEGIGQFRDRFNENISCGEYNNKVVVTEFSDPNPFKVLHIGHLYTSMVGESISRLLEYAGAKVYRTNFGGDVGLHVGKTLYVMMKKGLKDFTIEDIAKCYVEGTRAYEEDEAARRGIVDTNKAVYEIAENDLHDSALAEAYWKGRALSYDYFNDFYKRIGVKFDKYYPESTVAKRGLTVVKENIPNVYQLSDGAIVFKGEDYNLHTRVFINKEGLPTYEAKDVGLLFTKNEDYKFDESVVITGNDITDYMKVVLKSVEQYAPELVEKTTHITHGNVRLPGNEKMSSRKGNFVKAIDVLDSVQEMTDNEMIALGAIRYAFLKYKIGNNIVFDAKESVSLTGNSGPYLQYSAVRAKKILAGVKKSGEEVREFQLEPEEIKLNKKFMQYKGVLSDAVKEKAPHLVCNYLFELAQEFSRFYENCRVMGDEFENERAGEVKVFLNIMEHGLGILGIEIPDEM